MGDLYVLVWRNPNLAHDVRMQPASNLNVNVFLTEEELNYVQESTNSEGPYGVAVMSRSAVVGHWHAEAEDNYV